MYLRDMSLVFSNLPAMPLLSSWSITPFLFVSASASLPTYEPVYVQFFRVACSLQFFCVSFCHVIFVLSVSVLVVLSFVLSLLMFVLSVCLALSVFMSLTHFYVDDYCACFVVVAVTLTMSMSTFWTVCPGFFCFKSLS